MKSLHSPKGKATISRYLPMLLQREITVLFPLALALFFLNGIASLPDHATATQEDDAVLRATLSNGLRVVIVRDVLAPVVAIELSVLAGSNEAPSAFPGMAHAQEHMAFRGCKGMTSDQTAALYAELGGEDNANTEEDVTKYYVTVPSADLDIALQAQAACARGIDDSQEEWAHERGAIDQEIAEDLADPWYLLAQHVKEDMFSGTPYARDPLGSRDSFAATTGEMLKEFHRKWYAPNNMILVILGDVNSHSVLAKVQSLFGILPRSDLPPKPSMEFKPVRSESFTIESDSTNTVAAIAFRFPGTEGPDFPAIQVLAGVLTSRRGDLSKMEYAGKALATNFDLTEVSPKASVGYAIAEIPSNASVSRAVRAMRKILGDYAKYGVPEDLVQAAKRSELASAEFQRTSIPGLADAWSDALALEGRDSPDEDVEAIKNVTTADVNRMARTYLDTPNFVVGMLIPSSVAKYTVSNAQVLAAERKNGGVEKLVAAPEGPVQLPDWAAGGLEQLRMPVTHATVSDTILANGIRLVVQTDSTSPTVFVRGSIKQVAELKSVKDDVATSAILEGLYQEGTQKTGRRAFEEALDDIAADETAGYRFSLDVLKENFSRGVQLLAENELYPAFHSRKFRLIKRQASRSLAGNLRSSAYRASRALTSALLPAGDPELLEISPAAIRKVGLKAVKRYYAAAVRPDLTTIVVVGDVSPVEAKAVIGKWFGGWRATGSTPQTNLPPVPLNKASTVHIADSWSMQDSVVIAEQLDLNRFDTDYYSLQLGDTILGGDYEAARLYHDLRHVAGYVYSVDLSLAASETRAMYSIEYGSDPRNTMKARSLIERDLEQMRTREVSAAELHQAKAFLLRQIPLSESSEEEVANGLLIRAEAGLPLDERAKAAERYLSLTAVDIKRAFAAKIRPEDFVQVVQGPPAP